MTVRIRVIPCLDVSNGRVVKGVNFVDLRDAGDPVEQAQAYDAAGADELCFLDIGASHEGRDTIIDVVRRTAEVCFMPLTVGGGVRTDARKRRPVRAKLGRVNHLRARRAREEAHEGREPRARLLPTDGRGAQHRHRVSCQSTVR